MQGFLVLAQLVGLSSTDETKQECSVNFSFMNDQYDTIMVSSAIHGVKVISRRLNHKNPLFIRVLGVLKNL